VFGVGAATAGDRVGAGIGKGGAALGVTAGCMDTAVGGALAAGTCWTSVGGTLAVGSVEERTASNAAQRLTVGGGPLAADVFMTVGGAGSSSTPRVDASSKDPAVGLNSLCTDGKGERVAAAAATVAAAVGAVEGVVGARDG
jgi:hypothetical protein